MRTEVLVSSAEEKAISISPPVNTGSGLARRPEAVGTRLPSPARQLLPSLQYSRSHFLRSMSKTYFLSPNSTVGKAPIAFASTSPYSAINPSPSFN
jgi:hypothetical protein